jgi:hypothetical protein
MTRSEALDTIAQNIDKVMQAKETADLNNLTLSDMQLILRKVDKNISEGGALVQDHGADRAFNFVTYLVAKLSLERSIDIAFEALITAPAETPSAGI